MYDVAPPPHAPTLLSRDQILHIARNGWLPFDLSSNLLAQISAVQVHVSSFFDGLKEDKAHLYPRSNGTEAGYYYVESEKEYLTLRHVVHGDTELEKQAARLWLDVAALLKRILVDLARALDFPLHVWDDFLDGCLNFPDSEEHSTPTLLRMFRYFPKSGFAAEHTDLGLLTLCVGDGKGLQVLGKSQKEGVPNWIDVDGPIILVGNILRDLTEGRVRAGLHRVVENPDGRSSLIFALRPSRRHEVDGTLLRKEGMINLDELWEKSRSGRININATKEIRDRQRQLRKGRLSENGSQIE